MKKHLILISIVFLSLNTFSQKKSTVTDNRDGQVYNTVEIGSTIWMADNLKYAERGSWCYENKDENCEQYGRLYNWKTAMNTNSENKDQGVCPEGWIIPSKSDWETLFESYKKTKDLTEGGESGLNIRFAGIKFPNDSFDFLAQSTAFWSSSKDVSITTGNYIITWYFYQDQKNNEPQRYSTDENYGQSIRCIKKK